jgi:hypothetical protein
MTFGQRPQRKKLASQVWHPITEMRMKMKQRELKETRRKGRRKRMSKWRKGSLLQMLTWNPSSLVLPLFLKKLPGHPEMAMAQGMKLRAMF